MISIQRAQDVKVDYADLILHSPVANQPGALDKVKQFIELSTFTYVGEVNGRVGAVYGLITPSLLSDQCYLWMLTTDVVSEHKFVFIRHSQLVIESILEQYTRIVGETSIADEKAIRWLKWLGAEYTYPKDRTMAQFVITRETFARRNG